MNRRFLITIMLFTLSFFCAGEGTKSPQAIIVMIADGCGYSQVEAVGYYQRGEKVPLAMTCLHSLAMSTVSADVEGYDSVAAWQDFHYVRSKATDSAASATALSTGVITNKGTLGLDPEGNRLLHITSRAKSLGKSVGLATTVQISHATPAGFVVHAESRTQYEEIARQMLLSDLLDVLIGAGHPHYDNDGKLLDPSAINETRYSFVGGSEVWENIIAGNVDPTFQFRPWTVIERRTEFQALPTMSPPLRLLGLAQVETTLQQKRSGDTHALPFEVSRLETVPTLSEISLAALHVLNQNPNGFFLMIEGGAIDWAGHENQSGRLIEEMVDFLAAVETVCSWIEQHSSWEETLLLVTSDHECGYLLGPGSNPEIRPIENRGAGNLPGMEWYSKEHTNALVPLYFKGAASEYLPDLVCGVDPVRGAYIKHSDLGIFMHHLWSTGNDEARHQDMKHRAIPKSPAGAVMSE